MSDSFWQTITDFEIERTKIDNRHMRSRGDMHALGIATRKLIKESYDLIRRVDEILKRETLQSKQQAASFVSDEAG